MEFTHYENSEGQLLITLVGLNIPQPLTVVYYSASRESTSFEIFDEFGESMGRSKFYPTANLLGVIHKEVVEELNLLLEEWGVQLSEEDFKEISSLAVSKCESLYGLGNDSGDCIVTIQ